MTDNFTPTETSPAIARVLRRWQPEHPDRIQLFSVCTPNCVKVAIALEEYGFRYDLHALPFGDDGTQSPDFLGLNPNGKIPVVIDPVARGGGPLALFESGAILIYLADKAGAVVDASTQEGAQVHQWLMYQMGTVGPVLGQVWHFAGRPDAKGGTSYALNRFGAEARRVLTVLDRHLDGRSCLTGRFSIADMALWPWLWDLRTLTTCDALGLDTFENVGRYIDRHRARPSVQRGVSRLACSD